LFTNLNALKEQERALWNGADGAWPELLETGNDEDIFAYRRALDGSEVVVAANLSRKSTRAILPISGLQLKMGTVESAADGVVIPAAGYAIWTRN
jgi:hypothetical protein